MSTDQRSPALLWLLVRGHPFPPSSSGNDSQTDNGFPQLHSLELGPHG